jgi:antitoxin CptB
MARLDARFTGRAAQDSLLRLEPIHGPRNARGMDEPMDEVETRRKRLLYQSAHRGTKESDLLLGAFAAAHLSTFTPAQLDRYATLLDENDRDIFDWATGAAVPPDDAQSDVLTLLLNFRYPGAI